MSSRSVSALLLLLVALNALLSFGCQRDAVAPPLVDITEATPREVELGDRLELRGAGFPQGRPAHITFQGNLFRAGERPQHGVTIEAEGVVTTPDRLEVAIQERVLERFCGRGDQGAHATFRGDVEVAFTSAIPGAPPLVGKRRAITLDLRPSSVRASLLDARTNEGTRVLAFLGIGPGPITLRGLPIERVTPGSQADQAGFQTGDVVAAVDGVNVREIGDVVPLSNRTIELTIRHSDTGSEEVKTLSMLAYAGERIPTELAPALVIVGLALAVLVLLVMPGPMALSLLEVRIAARLRRKRVLDLALTLFGRGKEAVVSVFVTAICLALAILAPSAASPTDLDGVALFATAVSLLVASRIAAARGFVGSLRMLLDIGTAAIVLAGALAVLVAHLGGVSLGEIAKTQGGAPWEVAAARHPGTAIALLVYLVAIVSVLRVRAEGAARTIPQLLERASVLFAAALGTVVFFGAWQIPGSEGARSTVAVLGGGLLFVLKTWALAAAFWAAARAFATHASADVRRISVRRLVPLVLVAAGLVALSRKLVPSITLETAFGATSAALFVLLVIRSCARVRAALARPEPHASPFL